MLHAPVGMTFTDIDNFLRHLQSTLLLAGATAIILLDIVRRIRMKAQVVFQPVKSNKGRRLKNKEQDG